MNKKIFIVEDDENIREMVRMALTSFSYDVTAFDNAEDALAAVNKSVPDMIVFDIMLPGMSGLEATKALRNKLETKNLPIVMLTAKDTELDKVTGLDCGADDYISKPFGVMELGARIRSIFRRTDKDDTPLIEDIAISGLLINNNTREVMQNNTPLDLTFKEYELLCMLVKERDRIVPREELINAIWGFDFIGESRTLDIHVRTLRQKLGDDADNPRYIKTIRNVGYRFIGE
ncbi:MAG: response regulator transcription factor [Oscillospiraceae bacterium]|nr:response regulator transcription factor [Oscillospiraceae bacterium]